jgi:sugar/nucleoside kinase (ribokinase family)
LGGLGALIALDAVRRGARVELVGAIGDDADGNEVAVALGRAGVGHAALLRDPAGATPVEDASGRAPGRPAPRLDAGDVELGLRYLTDCRVLVVADALDDRAAEVTMDAAAYHGAPAIVIVAPGAPVPVAWDRGATVLAAPEPDEDGDLDPAPFASFVAGFAVALSEGMPAADALRRAAAGGGWERATDA